MGNKVNEIELKEGTGKRLSYNPEVVSSTVPKRALQETITGSSVKYSMWIGTTEMINIDVSLISRLRDRNHVLEAKIQKLRELQQSNLPHRRLAKYGFLGFGFFLAAFISRLVFDELIVVPFWNNVGLFFSFGLILMSRAMAIDWHEKLRG